MASNQPTDQQSCLTALISYCVTGCLLGAIILYVNAFYILEINESYKFRTPESVWWFEFNIWWPLVFVQSLLFGLSIWILQYCRPQRFRLRRSSLTGVCAATIQILYGPLIFGLADNLFGGLMYLFGGPILIAAFVTRVSQPTNSKDEL